MRISRALAALFPPVRRRLLAALLLQPDRWWFQSELAAHLATTSSSLQRELASLSRAGLLESKREGRRRYFRAARGHPLFGDLHGIFEKTAGIAPALTAELARYGERIRWALLYGSVARGDEHDASDVDLLVVGDIGTADLLPALRRLERKFKREINVIRYSQGEFQTRLQSGNHFLNAVLRDGATLVLGSKSDLERAAGRA